MKVPAQKQNQPQHQVSSNITRPSVKPLAPNHTLHPILNLQRTIGNQAVQRLLSAKAEDREAGSDTSTTTRIAQDFSRLPVYSKTAVSLRAKLTVSTPGDIYEQEADAMADKVVRMSDNLSPGKPLSESLAPVVQPHSEGGVAVSDTLSDKITTSQGGGSKMDRNLQVFMQDRFSADFSQVRIHTDDKAVQMSRELGAQAFTVGRDIYFDSGKYSPGTDSGKHLLAHELTHTIQQGYAQTIQRHAGPLQQLEGLGINEEERPRAQKVSGAIQPKIQRSTTWEAGTVHETLNPAVLILKGGAPITWEMLNGTKLTSEAVAEGAIKLPTVKTSGADTDWKAKVDSVPAQKGSFDETVLAPGPWSTVAKKTDVGAKTGEAACSGAGNSTFTAKGKPSDDSVYKANRRHEDHHVTDHKDAFNDTVVAWDKKVEDAKKNGTEFKGTTADKATEALWAAMGGTPKKVATNYHNLAGKKGDDFHDTPAGGPMSVSNPAANADCSTSSIEVRNPS